MPPTPAKSHRLTPEPHLARAAEALEAAHALRSSDPPRAEVEARQALDDLRDAIGGRLAGPEAQDLRARGWIHIANFRRIRGDYAAAERYLDRAEEYLEKGSHKPEERSWLLTVRARHLADLRRLDEALALMDQVTAIQRWIDDPVELARHLISKSNIQCERDLMEEGLASLAEAKALLTDQPASWLHLAVEQIETNILIDLGRYEEADPLLAQLEALEHDTLNRARLLWLRGRLEYCLHRHDSAVAILKQAREVYFEAGVPVDAAYVMLDLAVAYLSAGRTDETRRLADEMLPLLQHLDVSRETFAALLLFHKAAQRDTLSADFVADISAYLKRGTAGPPLKFENPS